ncbi:hypothetical protein GW17_00032717 [Ensete ventricosum]|nr:hypothetical protein GW17_00032717 [Ensete ventricosum]
MSFVHGRFGHCMMQDTDLRKRLSNVELNRERRKKIACTGSGEKREFSPTVSLLVPVVAPTPSETNRRGLTVPMMDGSRCLLREEEMAAYVTHTPASSFDLFGTATCPRRSGRDEKLGKDRSGFTTLGEIMLCWVGLPSARSDSGVPSRTLLCQVDYRYDALSLDV